MSFCYPCVFGWGGGGGGGGGCFAGTCATSVFTVMCVGVGHLHSRGNVTAQDILSVWRPGFDTWPIPMGFVVERLAPGWVFRFSPVRIMGTAVAQ